MSSKFCIAQAARTEAVATLSAICGEMGVGNGQFSTDDWPSSLRIPFEEAMMRLEAAEDVLGES